MYYNTNREQGSQLGNSEQQTERQELRVLAYFRRSGARLSPEDIQDKVLPQTPLTSCRRAITNLTRDGFLVKTRHMKPGRYGKHVHTWELKRNQLVLF